MRTLAILTGVVLAGCATPDRFDGPIPVRNQHPAQLTALHLEPVGPRTVPEGTGRADLTLSYSSLFVNRATQGNAFVMDGEILRAGLRGRYGIVDYEKAFTPDPRSSDIFDLRRIDRERGALVVVRPDQYVSHVLPLHGYAELADFFAPLLVEATRRSKTRRPRG